MIRRVSPPDRADELTGLVRACPWLMDALTVVRDAGLPDAWVGAGALRDLVWDERYGDGFRPDRVKDIDVAFFDPADLSRERDDAATALLARARPALPWEATNQAAVHTWYAGSFGGPPVPPLRSITEAVATWPETATALAARLTAGGELRYCAPYGLADLLNGVWRSNPRRVSAAVARERLARKRPAERWPRLRVVTS
jgi:hypothetical protein